MLAYTIYIYYNATTFYKRLKFGYSIFISTLKVKKKYI